jgi:hypothetical protein
MKKMMRVVIKNDVLYVVVFCLLSTTLEFRKSNKNGKIEENVSLKHVCPS